MYNQLSSLYGNYRQVKFSDVYSNDEKFLADYTDLGIPTTITDESVKTLYYLLYAQYGNSTIANADTNQFKYKVFSLIFMYGPTWEKELQIQKDLRGLTDDELMNAGRQLYNHAYNPSTAISDDTTAEGTLANKELNYVDDQNVTHTNRSKLDAYTLLMAVLKRDVTNDFIKKFKPLFLVIVEPEIPLWYVEESEDD